MELYNEILAHAYANFQIHAEEIIESHCYQALMKIKAIVEDESLDDPECFYKVEEIIRALENIGTNGGFRHDF